MIPNQSKYDPKQLSRDSHHGLQLRHSSLKISLIDGMHHSTLTDRIDGGKEKQLSQQRPASLGDMPTPSMLSRTDFKQIQAPQLQDFWDSPKLSEIAYFTDQTRCRHLFDSFERKNRTTMGICRDRTISDSICLINRSEASIPEVFHEFQTPSPLSFLNPTGSWGPYTTPEPGLFPTSLG
jgi:hypothetical protein